VYVCVYVCVCVCVHQLFEDECFCVFVFVCSVCSVFVVCVCVCSVVPVRRCSLCVCVCVRLWRSVLLGYIRCYYGLFGFIRVDGDDGDDDGNESHQEIATPPARLVWGQPGYMLRLLGL
jgi:hypothetical protein